MVTLIVTWPFPSNSRYGISSLRVTHAPSPSPAAGVYVLIDWRVLKTGGGNNPQHQRILSSLPEPETPFTFSIISSTSAFVTRGAGEQLTGFKTVATFTGRRTMRGGGRRESEATVGHALFHAGR